MTASATALGRATTRGRSSTPMLRAAVIVLVTMLVVAGAFLLGRATVDSRAGATSSVPTQLGSSAARPALPDLSTSEGRSALVREFGPGSFGGVPATVASTQLGSSAATPALPDLSTPEGRAALVREFGPGSFGGAPPH